VEGDRALPDVLRLTEPESRKGFFLHDTGPSDGEKSSGEQFAFFGLISKADFPPLDCGTDSSHSRVVGGFHSLMIQKGEQVVPVFETQ
jgi:hypothetical protein